MKWKRNKTPLTPLLAQLDELLVSESYSETTLRDMRFVLKTLALYLKNRNLEEYTQDIGDIFINHCVNELKVCASRVSRAKNIISKLNRILQGTAGRDALLPDLSKKILLPQSLSDALDAYIDYSAKKGNRSTTTRNHYLACGKFLQNLAELGCTQIGGIAGENIQSAFLAMG